MSVEGRRLWLALIEGYGVNQLGFLPIEQHRSLLVHQATVMVNSLSDWRLLGSLSQQPVMDDVVCTR